MGGSSPATRAGEASDVLDQITPVVLTFNEAPNIGRTLAMLDWARDIVVVDSFSTDETLDIVKRCGSARVLRRVFDVQSAQWNYAVKETGIRTEWVLALDADYVLSAELVAELKGLSPPAHLAAFRTDFRYCIYGRPLRGSVYPPVITLFRHRLASYEQDGHTQRVRIDGAVGRLNSVVYHDDRKTLAQWFASQSRYMELEAEKLINAPTARLSLADRLRLKIVVAPFVMLFYCAFVKGNILDGRAGLYYMLQRTTAELLLSLHLLSRRLTR